jgi:hypothetical protein
MMDSYIVENEFGENVRVTITPGGSIVRELERPAQLEPPAPRRITRLAFLSRFTDPEAVAIDLASIGATAQAAGMRRYMSKVNAATFIDLGRADTRAGVQALEAAGVLAAGRALQILDAPVQPEEGWQG